MGKRLAQIEATVDRCIVSPARRALETARIIAVEIGYPHGEIVLDGRLYEASGEDCLDVVHAVGDGLTLLLLIGHNPGLQDTAEALAPGLVDSLPTCGLVQMTFDAPSWSAIGRETLVDGLVIDPRH
jgi:phosphohistidine phosphatase